MGIGLQLETKKKYKGKISAEIVSGRASFSEGRQPIRGEGLSSSATNEGKEVR